MHITVYLLDKIFNAIWIPIISIKHFRFEMPKESLACSIIWGTVFFRHRSCEACFFHYQNPFCPPIMASSIRMHNRFFIWFKSSNSILFVRMPLYLCNLPLNSQIFFQYLNSIPMSCKTSAQFQQIQ